MNKSKMSLALKRKGGSFTGLFQFVLIVMLLFLSFGMLTTANAAGSPSGNLTVTLWGIQSDLRSQRAALERYQEEYPNVNITIRQGDAGVSYADAKILIAGGTMADVFVPGIWNYNEMIRDGVLMDLEPYIQRDNLTLTDFNETS